MAVIEELLVLGLTASAAGVVLVFGLYPLVVAGAALWARRGVGLARSPGGAPTSASLIVAVRNAEALIEEKVRNSLALEPGVPLQIVFVSDGSSDGTAARLRAAGGERIEVLEIAEHVGKAAALNRGVERCRGEVLVFSDADALLAPRAVTELLGRFSDPGVGGVCGQRAIQERLGDLTRAQGSYIAADSALKRAEDRVGSITSNDGKLYAIRHSLFRPIAAGATDDLFACLSVVEQGQRFVFEPRALAFIRTPSRSPGHELARRRRIVARSLHGIFLKRHLLNPLRHGVFALQLLVNKVFRRLLPVFLIGLFASSLVLGFFRPWAWAVCLLQGLFYGLALVHPWLRKSFPPLTRVSALVFYFCVGNLGTLLGLADFVRGRETIKWDPLKAG